MFAGFKSILALAAATALAAALSACDLSQKKPETGMTLQGTSAQTASHERSVRLYGPGVSRQRQTRI